MLKDKNIQWILLSGLIIRVFFSIWGAPVYYGTPDFATNGGDTFAWISAMKNLIHHGIFSTDLSYPGGKFFRPPGYTFFMSIFYLIAGCNLALCVKITMWVQVVLDCFTIYLVFATIKNIGGSNLYARTAAFLYAFYPFIIVWNPVLYAESPSMFFLFSSLYFLTLKEGKYNYIKCGILLGITVLLRLQCIFILPSIIYYLIKKHGSIWAIFKKPAIVLLLSFCVVYGSWPFRNLLYGEFVPAERLENNQHFSKDYFEFMLYIWSVKTDHRPQYDEIIHGQPVEWPKASYLEKGDSALLADLAVKCNTCGRGFSNFKASAGIIPKPITEENACTIEIGETFKKLRLAQIQHNRFHYFITVPLGNLKKALFKTNIYGDKSFMVKIISTTLFGFRTIMILLGMLGIWMNRKLALLDRDFTSMILIHFITLYFALCFGYRDIEIRYFVHPDVLLLLTAAIPVLAIIKKWLPIDSAEKSVQN